MNNRINPIIGRRALLHGLAIGTVAATTAATNTLPAKADTETPDERRKARYQAHSPEVQTFYRVNRYPGA
jgi:hypothetical protein